MGLTQKLGTIPLAIQTDSSNNVGIGGAANASYKLAVTGASLFTSALTSTNSAGTFFSATNTVGGFAKLEISANATSIATLSFTNSLNLTGGNVGIGTTNPTDKLTISGRLNLQGLQQNSIWFNQNAGGTSTGYIVGRSTNSNDAQNFFIYDVAAAAFRMTITSDGQLQIKQSANTFSDGLRLINSANAYWGLVSGGDTNLYLGYNSPTISVGVFNSSTGTYTATSDINKKKDFEQSTIGLDAVLGLKPTLYRMKTDSETTEKHLGFIAQEVKEFIPQAYSENTNGDSVFIGLTEMPIIAALVKAIQELSAKVTALENK